MPFTEDFSKELPPSSDEHQDMKESVKAIEDYLALKEDFRKDLPLNLLVTLSYVKKKYKVSLDEHQDVKESVKAVRDWAALMLAYLIKHKENMDPEVRAKMVEKTKESLLHGINLKDYYVSVDLASDPEKAQLQDVKAIGADSHMISDELIIRKLFEDCKVTDFHVDFDQIVGNEDAKEVVKNIAVKPFVYQNIAYNTKTLNAALLFGAPGNGKSILAYAAGNAMKEFGHFFKLSPDVLKQAIHGQTDRFIGLFFKMARRHGRAIIFLDECDSLCSKRSGDDKHGSQMKSQLIEQLQMDKPWNKNLVLLGATNLPEEIGKVTFHLLFFISPKKVHQIMLKGIFTKKGFFKPLMNRVCFDFNCIIHTWNQAFCI